LKCIAAAAHCLAPGSCHSFNCGVYYAADATRRVVAALLHRESRLNPPAHQWDDCCAQREQGVSCEDSRAAIP
jgi:hypothetical protein